MVGLLMRTMYGTQDAANLWQKDYTNLLHIGGFVAGKSSSAVFYSARLDSRMLVHGDDFVMLNNIDMYEKPLQVEGVEPGNSSEEVLDKYMEYMYPALFARASHPVFFGDAASIAMELLNTPGMDVWSQGALMR